MIILFANTYKLISSKKYKSIFYYILGELFYSLKNYKKAESFYSKYSLLNATNDYILFKMGNCYHRFKDYQSAINVYESARIINKNNFDLVSNLGLSYYFSKNYSQSINIFKLSLEL